MKTTTVEIPVAIDEDGGWFAAHCGSHLSREAKLDRLREKAKTYGVGISRVVWVMATAPLPKHIRIKGTVEE